MRFSLLILTTLLLLSGCGETKVYPATTAGDAGDTSSASADAQADAAPDVQLDVPAASADTASADTALDASPEDGSVTDTPEDATTADVPEVCVPVTCELLGFNCGAIDDQCGNTISCGLCSPPNTVGLGHPQVCGASDCEVKACGDDGCGGLRGTCEDPTPNCTQRRL